MDYRHLNVIWRSELRSTTKLVAIALADFIDKDSGNAWPRLEDLEKRTGLCERQIRRDLALLVEAGLFEVKTHTEDGTRMRYPRYRWCHVERTASPEISTGRTGGPEISTANADPQSEVSDHADSQSGDTGPTVHDDRTGGQSGRTVSPVDPIHPGTTQRSTPSNARGGVGRSTDEKRENRERLDACLAELEVAVGPTASLRWAAVAMKRGANGIAEILECIRFCVRTARAKGRSVNLADDIQDIAKTWSPLEIRMIKDTDPRLGETA